METLISFDIKGDFGMLKKPDTNEPVYLTFNMLHKPALLGILGAILGLKGFVKQKELPEYFQKMENLKVGIKPLNHESGNFSKTVIKYNNGTGMASEETGGNLMISEQTLINPAFRCYILLNVEIEINRKLIESILNYHSEYIPYLGKNDCSIWWENSTNLKFDNFYPKDSFTIDSLFIKEKKLKDGKVDQVFSLIPSLSNNINSSPFMYFERLPVSYIGAPLFQYDYKNFAYTNARLKTDYTPSEDLPLIKIENGDVIQVF